MKTLILKVLVNAAALWFAAWLLAGIRFTSKSSDTVDLVLTVVLVAVVFTVVNLIVKPITTMLTLPAVFLTLGLFLLVINALMLQLTSWLAGKFELGFHVDHFFWDAVLGALIVSISTMVLNAIFKDD